MRLLVLAVLAAPAIAAAQSEVRLLGAGLYSRPKFDGSPNRTVDVIPAVRYYGQPWFARTTQGMFEGGTRWKVREGLDIGAQLAYEQGPRDDDPGASIGVHAEAVRFIGPVPFNGLIRLRQHLDTDRGVQLDARTTAGAYQGHGIIAGVFAQATWASGKSFETYYGVRDSGLLFTSLGALASYDLARRWMLLGSLEHRRLSDDAARSAIVERRSGAYASVSLAYRF